MSRENKGSWQWELKVLFGRKRVGVEAGKREEVEPEGTTAQQVSRDLQGLAEAGLQNICEGWVQRGLDRLRAVQDMKGVVTVLEAGSHGLPEADLEALRHQVNLRAEKAGREPPYG